jgi:hypothetical protein
METEERAGTSGCWAICGMAKQDSFKVPRKFFFGGVRLGFELGLHACNILPLEPHLQSILLWLFWRWGSLKLLVQAGLEHRSSQSQPLK